MPQHPVRQAGHVVGDDVVAAAQHGEARAALQNAMVARGLAPYSINAGQLRRQVLLGCG